jgi:hypothetical protein
LRERLKNRRKESPKESKYLASFENDEEPYDPLIRSKEKRFKNSHSKSGVKDRSLSKKFLASLRERNLSVASGNKSILSAA